MVDALLAILVTVGSINDSISNNYCGVKVGGNAAVYHGHNPKTENIYHPQVGAAAGAFFIQNMRYVGFKEEILFKRVNFQSVEFSNPIDVTVDYLSIPFLFRIRPNPFDRCIAWFSTGISIDFQINGTVGYNEGPGRIVKSTLWFYPYVYTLPVGIGFDYLTGRGVLSAEFRYTIDVTNVDNIYKNERTSIFYFYIEYGFAYPHPIPPKEIVGKM